MLVVLGDMLVNLVRFFFFFFFFSYRDIGAYVKQLLYLFSGQQSI